MPPAGTAAGFIEALGVNTHLQFLDTAYANFDVVQKTLAYLGIKRVRDYAPPPAAAAYDALAAEGVKLDFLVSGGGAVDLAAVMTRIAAFEARHPGATASIEGANETNLWPVTYRGRTGYAAAITLQKDLYAAVKADAVLSHIPVYATTLGGATQEQYRLLGDLSAYTDYGNAHIYPSSAQTPTSAPYPSLVANLPWQTPHTPGKPNVITEGGYYTRPGGDPAWPGVNEEVQAKYTLSYLLDAAALGVRATYLYELLDERPDPKGADREQHFGLFHADGTPKKAAVAIHNLTTIMADTGSGAPGAKPAYTLSGMPATGHSLALSKSDGATLIAVWAEPGLWDAKAGTPIAAPASNVTLTLGARYAAVRVFDPLVGTAAIQRASNTSTVSLRLTDHPLIVEVTPFRATVARGAAAVLAADAPQRLGFLADASDDGREAEVAHFYRAALGRAPDADGLEFWTGRMQDGVDAAEVADGFLATPEARTRPGAADDAGWVAQLYRDALGREGEAGGTAHWAGELAGGASRGAVLVGFCATDEFRQAASVLFAGAR